MNKKTIAGLQTLARHLIKTTARHLTEQHEKNISKLESIKGVKSAYYADEAPTHDPVDSHDQEWWDKWFLGLAQYVSTASKDPSTQVGAVIVEKNTNRIISLGFNGFPRGIEDSKERLNNRETKYKLVIHAERNAILFAQRSLDNCTLYTYPFQPCAECTGFIIQAGIKRCVSILPTKSILSRWKESIDLSKSLMQEADVELKLYSD